MITLADYFTRRSTGEQMDVIHRDELTDQVVAYAQDLIGKVNVVLTKFYEDCPDAPRRTINSGWRPKKVNAEVGGAPSSCHLTGQAIDLSDGDRLLAKWCAENTEFIKGLGLCGERPEATPTWIHLQTKPVGSGITWYWPSTKAYEKWAASGQKAIVA